MSIEAVPQLRTERLLLRGWRDADLEAYAALGADAEVMRHVGDVLDREQSWRQMALHAGHWTLRGYGNWAVERVADGVLIGRCGLWNPEGWPGVEVGWVLARAAWGHGYATEAGAAAMNWAWNTLALPRLVSVIRPDNARSIRVAKRLGLRPLRHAELHGHPVLIFGAERPGRRST